MNKEESSHVTLDVQDLDSRGFDGAETIITVITLIVSDGAVRIGQRSVQHGGRHGGPDLGPRDAGALSVGGRSEDGEEFCCRVPRGGGRVLQIVAQQAEGALAEGLQPGGVVELDLGVCFPQASPGEAGVEERRRDPLRYQGADLRRAASLVSYRLRGPTSRAST